jgi:hypothetical protein
MIMAKQVSVKPNEIPEGWSLEAVDFVNRVIYLFNYTIYILVIAKETG